MRRHRVVGRHQRRVGGPHEFGAHLDVGEVEVVGTPGKLTALGCPERQARDELAVALGDPEPVGQVVAVGDVILEPLGAGTHTARGRGERGEPRVLAGVGEGSVDRSGQHKLLALPVRGSATCDG
jgi:hypothetical protein